MGVFTHSVEVGNPEATRFQEVEAIVDTSASYSQAPASFLRGLGIEPHRKMDLVLADGRTSEVDLGRTWVQVDGQREITLMVFGEEGSEALLGAYTLEGLGLAVDPVARRLVPASGYRLTRSHG